MRRALIALLLGAAPICAQQPVASPYAVLVGAVVDSIHGGPLTGAIVIVSGTDRQGIVDSTGRFRIDSIPPGDHEIGVFHPLLDSLSLSVGSKSVAMTAGQATTVILATPSAPTVVGIYCSDTGRKRGPAAVIGRVLAPDSDDPIPNAVVRYTATWMPPPNLKSVVKIAGTTFIQDAPVTSTGLFVLCGLPTRGGGTVHASRGQVTTGEMPADVSRWLVAVVTVRLDTVKRGTAVVLGHIVDDKGAPIPRADVALAGSRVKTVTSDSGTFALRDLPGGSQTIQIRKVGFTATDTALMLSSKTPVQFQMIVHSAPVRLSTVNIEAVRQAALTRVGFEQRRKRGVGFYLTGEQVRDRGGPYLSDIARTVPGLMVRQTRLGQVILQGRGQTISNRGCVVYMIDRVPYTDRPLGSIDSYVLPDDIIGLEVYQPAEAPADLVVAPQTCATVVIWTRATSGGD